MKDRRVFLHRRDAGRYSMARLDAPLSPIIYPRERPRAGLRTWLLMVCVLALGVIVIERAQALGQEDTLLGARQAPVGSEEAVLPEPVRQP